MWARAQNHFPCVASRIRPKSKTLAQTTAMATAASNMKKRKPDQDSDHLVSKQPISYIPKHDAGDSSDDSDADPTDPAYITRLLETLTREQLLAILRSAALSHPPTLDEVRRTAEQDPSHRKIFVHGLDWSTTADSIRIAFSPFGPIEEVRIVTDKSTGKSKGYGFILFRTRRAAKKALEQPQKLIDGRMTACQLASVGPTSNAPAAAGLAATNNSGSNRSDNLPRKVFVGNVQPTIDRGRLRSFFAQYGEIEEGPLGFDRATGKPRGFALFVYKTLEGARRALEEPSKNFEGHVLVCQMANDSSNRGARGANWQANPIANANPNGNANPNPNHSFAQNVAVVPGNVGQGYPGPVATVPGAVPDMTALLAQGLMQPNALLAVLAAAHQNQGAFGLNPALLASFNPAALAAAFGGASAQNVSSGVQPVSNQGYGGMSSVGYQQNVGGFQAPSGFQGPPGFQNAASQVGTHQAGVAGSGGSYTGQTPSLSRPSAGQMGGYGLTSFPPSS